MVSESSLRVQEDSRALIRFKHTLRWIAFLTFELIILGALVRATDSGLACPDWPLCYDKWVPVMDVQIFLEWVHRANAALLGFVVLFGAWQVLSKKQLRQMFMGPIVFSFCLFIVQCVLGGLTVLKLLDPTIVSMHLANALLFFGLILWMCLRADFVSSSTDVTYKPNVSGYFSRRRVLWGFGFLAVLVAAQMLLGGSVASNYAGTACPDFPTCHGEWVPTSGNLAVWLQVGHRVLAGLILFAVVMGSVLLDKDRMPSHAANFLKVAPVLVGIQILLGIVNVLYVLPVWATVAHSANALLLFTLALLAFIHLWMTIGNAQNHAEPLKRSGKKAAFPVFGKLGIQSNQESRF